MDNNRCEYPWNFHEPYLYLENYKTSADYSSMKDMNDTQRIYNKDYSFNVKYKSEEFKKKWIMQRVI